MDGVPERCGKLDLVHEVNGSDGRRRSPGAKPLAVSGVRVMDERRRRPRTRGICPVDERRCEREARAGAQLVHRRRQRMSFSVGAASGAG
jgi:hypothetical protein